MSSLREHIQTEIKDAMRAKEQKRLDALRLLSAAIKQREVDERITLNDDQVIDVISKMLKQRKDSVSQFEAAGRTDLADQENYEIQLLQTYLPAQLSEAEVTAVIKEVIAATGATSAKDMGKVMGMLKPKIAGKADMGVVSTKIKELLG